VDLESSTNNLLGDGFGFGFCFSVSQPLTWKWPEALTYPAILSTVFGFSFWFVVFGFVFPLAATDQGGLLFNFRSITRCDQTSIQAGGL